MPNRLTSTPIFYCESGLDVTQDILARNVGGAVDLINFEPSLQGGYRRINGFDKYSDTVVPGSGKVMASMIRGNKVFACRESSTNSFKIFEGEGSSWTELTATQFTFDSTRDGFDFSKYNWTGVDRTILVSGDNLPLEISLDEVSTSTVVELTLAPADATTVTTYKTRAFFGGYTSNKGAITFSAPSNSADYSAANGAGEIVVGDEVVKLVGFRDQLIILCRNSIHALIGDSLSNFTIEPITQNFGCVSAASVQEIGGDVIFLAPDGIRTVAGTARNQDFNLESISRAIQPTLGNATSTLLQQVSLVIREKSQYRLFYPETGTLEPVAKGIIGGIRRFRDSSEGWEWGELLGMKPSSADSDIVLGDELIIHGGYDGFIYEHDTSNSFDGSNIPAVFETPDIDLSDALVRKNIHKILTYYRAEGNLDVNLELSYDRGTPGVTQPGTYNYNLNDAGLSAYGNASTLYGSSLYGIISRPFNRLPVQGSGFIVRLKYTSNNTFAPYTLQGFAMSFKPQGRR